MNYLVKQFAICLDMVFILLLNFMEVFSVGGCALLDRPCVNRNFILIINRILNGIHSSNIVLH